MLGDLLECHVEHCGAQADHQEQQVQHHEPGHGHLD